MFVVYGSFFIMVTLFLISKKVYTPVHKVAYVWKIFTTQSWVTVAQSLKTNLMI